jgi:hypothetical protein
MPSWDHGRVPRDRRDATQASPAMCRRRGDQPLLHHAVAVAGEPARCGPGRVVHGAGLIPIGRQRAGSGLGLISVSFAVAARTPGQAWT